MTPSGPPPPLAEIPRYVQDDLPPLPENPTEPQILRRMRKVGERLALLSYVDSVPRQLDNLYDPRSLGERMDDPVGHDGWIQWENGVYAAAGDHRDYSIAEVDELDPLANAGPHPEDRYGPENDDITTRTYTLTTLLYI
ncbi:hypothetical protein FOL46_001684, partial [Perkinsus olseni]